MPSAFILSVHSYPAMPRAGQLAHQRYVPPNPLVLGRKLLKSPTPTTDRDRPVSRRSKPSSRTAFIGEQPNPWELLHPQDAMSRHRTESMLSHGADYIIILSRTLAPLVHSLAGKDKSRRVASERIRSLPFRVSRYGVIHPPVGRVETSHGIAAWRIELSQLHGRVHRYKPICWYGITPTAPRCVKVPNLLAAVNAQRR